MEKKKSFWLKFKNFRDCLQKWNITNFSKINKLLHSLRFRNTFIFLDFRSLIYEFFFKVNFSERNKVRESVAIRRKFHKFLFIKYEIIYDRKNLLHWSINQPKVELKQ